MEFIRDSCIQNGSKCSYCSTTDWVSPSMNRIPHPMPDMHNPGHYMDVFETPNTNRTVDDYQPRANLKKLYVSKQLNDEAAISRFAEKYIVSVNSVKNYIEHLRNLERMKNIRSRHRLEVQKKRENKNYNDYDWLQLFISGTLEKLNVKELDKYLDKHKLPKYRKLKGEKVDIISTHILGTPEFRSRKVTANELQTTTTDI